VTAQGRYEVFLLTSGAIWGTSFAVTKVGLDSVDPLFFALLRFLLGAALMVVAVAAMRRFDPAVLRDPAVIALSVVNALAFALQNIGLEATTATNSALLINVNVGIVAVLAAVVLKEELTRRTGAGLLLGLAGVVLISTNGDLGAIARGSLVGDLTVFGAGALWAVYIVYMKRTLGRQRDVLMVSTAIIAETALFLVPLTLLFAGSYALPGEGAWTVVYTGVVCTGLAYLLYNAGLQRVRASVSAVLLLVEPVFGIAFAVLLLQEWPGPTTALGAALVLLSIAVIAFANGREGSAMPTGTGTGSPGPARRRPW